MTCAAPLGMPAITAPWRGVCFDVIGDQYAWSFSQFQNQPEPRVDGLRYAGAGTGRHTPFVQALAGAALHRHPAGTWAVA